MPTAEMTTAVEFWPLRTRAEMCEALWDIMDTVPTAAASIIGGYNGDGSAMMMFQVITGGVVVVSPDTARMGDIVIVRSAVGWETLTVDQATARGIPVHTTPDS